jgi:hypothetical protein
MSRSYVQILSSPGWLTSGRGEERREEKRLCSSSSCLWVAQKLCEVADEEERERDREREGEKSGRQESGIMAKVEKRGGKRVEKKRNKYVSE